MERPVATDGTNTPEHGKQKRAAFNSSRRNYKCARTILILVAESPYRLTCPQSPKPQTKNEHARGQESDVCSTCNPHSAKGHALHVFGLGSVTGIMPNGSMGLSGSARIKRSSSPDDKLVDHTSPGQPHTQQQAHGITKHLGENLLAGAVLAPAHSKQGLFHQRIASKACVSRVSWRAWVGLRLAAKTVARGLAQSCLRQATQR